MKKLMIFSLLASMALALSGCGSTSNAGPFGQNNTANGALLGGLTGAGIGAMAGGKKATLTGALVGTGVGAMAGNAVDQNRAQQMQAYPPPPPGPPSYGGPPPGPRSY
ncbi:MAG: YMGG-like glycine zipper-containing protein [Candidatus Sumerlaeaceae bacterium]